MSPLDRERGEGGSSEARKTSAEKPGLTAPIEIRRLGRVEYEDGLRLQEIWTAAVHAGVARDTLFLLEHDDVITLGRGGDSSNILFSRNALAEKGVTVHETGRGGDVTFHGPGQIVGYPIFNLAVSRETKDVRRHVRALEELMIRTAADFGVRAERVDGLTGVWVGRNKLGAIGVRVAKWITSHGFAFNVNSDLARFDLIVPCGISDRGVTSLRKELGHVIPLAEVEDRLEQNAAEIFARDLSRRDVHLTTVAVLVRRGAEVLCLKRTAARGGFWQIVTGRIESGETARQAAARELREETGFEVGVKPLEYEHAFALENPEALGLRAPALGREMVFVAEAPPGAASRVAPDEHEEHAWLSREAALARVRHAGHKRAIRNAIE